MKSDGSYLDKLYVTFNEIPNVFKKQKKIDNSSGEEPIDSTSAMPSVILSVIFCRESRAHPADRGTSGEEREKMKFANEEK